MYVNTNYCLPTKLRLSGLHPSRYSLWSWNMVPHLTVGEESGHIWPVVSVSYTTSFLEAHISNEEVFQCTDQPPLRHHPYDSSELLCPLCFCRSLCRSIHAPQSRPLGQCDPFANRLELPIRLTMPHLAPDYWIRSGITRHWSGNCLSQSAESTSMEHAHRNGNIHRRTSHMMMIIIVLYSVKEMSQHCTLYMQILVLTLVFTGGWRIIHV